VKIKVEVQPKHVKKGICSDPKKCAVAVALIENGFKGVQVFGPYFDAYEDVSASTRIPLPFKVKRFIDRFDDIGSCNPTRRRELAEQLRTKPLSFILKLTPEQITKYLIPKAAKKLLKSKAA
jgi:hypothetical protein